MPRDGAWSSGQRAKNDALYWLARIIVAMLLALPRALLPPLGRAMGVFFWLVLRPAQKIAATQLRMVHPCWSDPRCQREARQVFAGLGECLTDAVALLDPREAAERTLDLDDASAAVLDQALAERRGVVYMTCHLGPWERMAALLAARGYPISTVARESYDPRYHALFYERLRDRRGVRPIYRGLAGAPFAIVRALRQGRVVGFLMDLPGRIDTIDVTLLGRPAQLPIGPLRIALRTRAPVVVGSPAPGNGHRRMVTVQRVITADLARDDELQLAQRIADALSARIGALSTHWPWMHPTFARARRSPAISHPPGDRRARAGA